MIIVEGPDGAGKTTLIKQLIEATGLPVAPRVVSKDAEAMVDLKRWTEENIKGGFQPLIFDRHRLISEPIYGPVLREKPEPGFDDVEWFHAMLAGLYLDVCPIIVYCLPPWPVVWANIMKSEDNRVFHGNPQGFRQIYQAYFNKAMTDQVLYSSSFTYDYTEPQIAPVVLRYLIGRVRNAVK